MPYSYYSIWFHLLMMTSCMTYCRWMMPAMKNLHHQPMEPTVSGVRSPGRPVVATESRSMIHTASCFDGSEFPEDGEAAAAHGHHWTPLPWWLLLCYHDMSLSFMVIKITLLRVIPTMTFVHSVTGKSSGILSDISSRIRSGILFGISSGTLTGISSGICSGISSGILSGISSGISSDILSGILSGKHSGTLSGIPSGILSGISSGILSGIYSDILSGISSGILSGRSSDILSGISSGILSDMLSGVLSGISSGILSDISSGILSGISSGISSDILSGILSGISSNILSGISSGTLSGISHGILSGISSGILSDILSGISSGILSGRWGPAVHTELGRSHGAHWAGQVPGWVQQCTLSWEGPRLRSSSAHWRNWRRRRRRPRRRRRRRRRTRRRTTALIKSNNPHLAGGEIYNIYLCAYVYIHMYTYHKYRHL